MRPLLILATLLLSGCVHRAPKPEPCCCVFGDNEYSDPEHCDPADCPIHHADVE